MDQSNEAQQLEGLDSPRGHIRSQLWSVGERTFFVCSLLCNFGAVTGPNKATLTLSGIHIDDFLLRLQKILSAASTMLHGPPEFPSVVVLSTAEPWWWKPSTSRWLESRWRLKRFY